jgi:hypothetical protein
LPILASRARPLYKSGQHFLLDFRQAAGRQTPHRFAGIFSPLAVVIFGAPMNENSFKEAANFKCAFARVASGKFFTGSSRSFKATVRKLS